MLANKELVSVTVNEQEVKHYDCMSGSIVPLGLVTSRVFDGEQVQRHFFTPYAEQTKEYRLPPTSTDFKFVDHAQAMLPFLRLGWQVKSIRLMRGGLRMWAILTPGDPLDVDDPVDWDTGMWGVGNGKLTEAVLIKSSITSGHGINYQFGFFRMVCTNGLVSELFGFGNMRYSHTNWSNKGVESFISSNRLERRVDPIIGNKAGLSKTADILRKLANKEYASVPTPIAKTLAPLSKLPKWYNEGLIEQFDLIQNNKNDSRVSTIDLLNSVTSPMNWREQNDGEANADRLMFKLDTIAYPLAQLTAFLSL